MRLYPLAVAGLAAAVAGLALARPAAPRKRALLVGVGHYSAALTDLGEAPVNDVGEMARVLKAGGYRGHVLTDRQATRQAVLDAFQMLLDGKLTPADPADPLTAGDTLLVHLCGHGLQFNEKGPDGVPAPRPYFCPTDAVPGRPDTLIGLGELVEKAAGRGVRAVFLVDACRQQVNPKLRAAAGIAGAWANMPANVSVLLSCRPGQVAVQDPRLGHGLFTFAVLRVLRGETGLAEVTWNGLVGAVGDQFTDPTGAVGKWLEGIPQTPVHADGESERTVLLDRVVRPGAVAEAVSRPVTERFVSAGEQRSRTTRVADPGGAGLKLVKVPAGGFRMGADETVAGIQQAFPGEENNPNFAHEFPPHQVSVSDFWVGQTEVTVAQFRQFVEATGHVTDVKRTGSTAGHFNPQMGGRYKDDGNRPAGQDTWESKDRTELALTADQRGRLPVVLVSHNDAAAFCKWLSRKTGHRFRLPTEAEWEYACRAGTQSRYWFGNDPEGLAGRANVPDAAFLADHDATSNRPLDYPTIRANDGFVGRSPAGTFEPNPFGLQDTHGNVWEWCSDWFDPGYYAVSARVDPPGPAASPLGTRCIRGGCHT